VTNASTGGQKGAKSSQLSAAPSEALWALGQVYGFGARKYDRHNFRKGYAWSLSYDAMLRHINASLGGEDYDSESGLPHMAHAAWHALTLTQFLIDKNKGRHPLELDDRFIPKYVPLPIVEEDAIKVGCICGPAHKPGFVEGDDHPYFCTRCEADEHYCTKYYTKADGSRWESTTTC